MFTMMVVPNFILVWICLMALSVVSSLASFAMPTYTSCIEFIILDSYTPAAKIKIDYQYLTVPTCLFRVRVHSSYKIGVLVLDQYKAAECPPQQCKCRSQPFRLHIKNNYLTYTDKWFCNTSEEGKLDTDIEADSSLDILWNSTGTPSGYTLLVFRIKKRCYSYEANTECPYTDRCIEDALLCTAPHNFCGDNTDLCTYDSTGSSSDSGTSKSGVITGLVVTSIVLILLGIVCYVCLGNGRACRNRRDDSQDQRTRAAAAREVFTIQLASRGVASNRATSGEDNTAYTEDPPEYDSLDITDSGNSTSAEIKEDLPPGYDVVMLNTNDYKVNYSPST